MRRIQQITHAIEAALFVSVLVICTVSQVKADTTSSPSLVVAQLKITSSSGQFVTLYNPTSTVLDMSKYQLEYFNNYDLSKSTSSRLITLSGSLDPHSYYMVNDSMLALCYQLSINSMSLGFSSTAGLIEVFTMSQAGPGQSAVPVLQDYVGWSKTTATGAQTVPSNTNAFLERQPTDDDYNPSISAPGSGSWQMVQPDANNPCLLVSATGLATPVQTGMNQLLPASDPPATIVAASNDDDSSAVKTVPASDIGLATPRISELLPNPDGTGNDTTDEYIELYNSNDRAFDLSGFVLQTGLSTLKSYNFPAGTSLPPHSFTAFYSELTSLSLSNSGSRALLVDPLGNTIASTDVYGSAKDGQTWALAKAKWQWTTTPTPNRANVIKVPSVKKTKKTVATSKSQKSATIPKTPKNTTMTAASYRAEEPSTTPIHAWTLALVVGGALLYGAYEYRTDMANRLYQLRRHLSARAANRL